MATFRETFLTPSTVNDIHEQDYNKLSGQLKPETGNPLYNLTTPDV